MISETISEKETIFRYMSGHPDQKPRHVLAAYMEYVAEKSYEGSCVYHTEKGCSLPRNMRSNTCNNFLCDSLIELSELFNKTPMPKVLYFGLRRNYGFHFQKKKGSKGY